MSQVRHEIPVSIRNPVVRAHSFDDRYLLPGLAYIDILFQAFTASGVPVDELELRDLAIHRALVLAPDEVVRLRIDASGEGDEWLVHVDGHVDGHDPAKARRYAVATMARRRLAMHVFGQNLDWNAVQSTSAEPLSMQEVYAASALVGLLHGDYMKADGLVYTTDEAIYVDCQLGADARADADDVLFHPALVDACVVGATAVLSTLDPNGYEAALPLSYGRFAASRPLGGACMARVMRDGVRRENGLTWLSMDFFDLEGRQIAELRDFASKRLPPSRRLAHDDDDGGAGDLAAGPPSPSKTEAAPTVDASSLATFVRDAIARRLRIDAAAIRGDIDFYELGIDSTGLLELAHAIQAHLHRKLPPTLLFQFSTIDEVVAHLVETAASAIFVAGPKPSATPAVTSTDERRDDDIAVVGLCGRFPQAGNVERFWEKLCAGADCIGMVPAERWDVVRYFDPRKGEPGKTYGKWGGFIEGVDAFDPLFFGMSPREAELTDPQQRLFLETVWNLLEECGYTRERLRSTFGGSVGVYVGSMYSQYDHLSRSSPTVLQSFQSAIANRVSHYFGLNGPSVAVDTMCSSFAVALHQACADLRRGDVAMAIAGAVNLSLDARKFVALSQALLLASRFDARSFADGDGYFPSETVGAVLLKPLRTAERDGDAIWGVIRATAVNHAGSGQAYSVPNGQAQVGVMCDVLRRANVEAGAIGYVEAAATGAAIGDAIEWGAIAQVFDGQPCAIGSVKSNMGHAEAASGFSQLAKVLLQLRHCERVPTIGSEPPNPNLSLEDTGLHLQRHRESWTRTRRQGREMPRLALINSFGAGGSNASLLVEEYRAVASVAPPRREGAPGPQVIVLSGRTASGRRAVAARLADWLQTDAGTDLVDLAYTLQEHREAMDWRLAMVASDVTGLVGMLRRYLASADDGATGRHEGDRQTASSTDAAPGEGDAAERLAWAWVRHRPVDWSASRGTGPFRRLALPTYPFERRRCWLPGEKAAETRLIDSDDTRTVARAWLEHALRVPAGTLDDARAFREYGVDSVVGLGLVRALNDRFATRLGGRVLFDHPTIERLADHVDALRRQHPAAPPEGDAMRGALREFKAGRLTRDQLKARLERSTAA